MSHPHQRPSWLARAGEPSRIAAGDNVLGDSPTPRIVAFLDDGVVKLVRRSANGEPARLIGFRFPGWFLGAESAIAGPPLPLSWIAATACRVYAIPRPLFDELVVSDPDLSDRIHQMHSRELFDLREDRAGASLVERMKRLATRLIEANEATALGKEVRLRIPFDRALLAETLGASPEMLDVTLDDLAAAGWLRFSDDTLIVSRVRDLRRAHVHDVGWPLNICAERIDDADGEAPQRRHAPRPQRS
jgi:CRP-like cAMP-binding protein